MSDSEREIIEELIALRRSPRLNPKQKKRAKKLLVTLKFTHSVDEIAAPTGWNPSTIKPYVKGVRTRSAEPSGSPSVVAEMIVEGGMNLENAKRAVYMKKIADTHNIPLDEFADALERAYNSGIGIVVFVSIVVAIRKAGIEITELPSLAIYKKQLDEAGIDVKMLGELAELISKQGGDFYKTTELIKKRGNFESLQAGINDLQARKKSLEDEVQSLEEKKVSLRKQNENAINKARLDVESAQTRLEELRMKYFHLRSIISMCEDMLAQSNIEELRRFLSVAKQIYRFHSLGYRVT